MVLFICPWNLDPSNVVISDKGLVTKSVDIFRSPPDPPRTKKLEESIWADVVIRVFRFLRSLNGKSSSFLFVRTKFGGFVFQAFLVFIVTSVLLEVFGGLLLVQRSAARLLLQ